MGNLKNILIHLEKNQREYEELGIDDKHSHMNQGWLECAQFFFRNFDITEKTIKKERE